MDLLHSTPVTPSSPNQSTKELKSFGADPALPTANSIDTRSINLEIVREQLRAAKIPLTKRASINEVPQSADDCSFVPGTTRCKLDLCGDSCTQAHQHHHTHARPSRPDAPLVYSRPSISMLPGSGVVSNFASPAGSPSVSVPTSQTNSPQQQYRRASAFGFNFGTRGSVTSTSGFFGSGGATPADIASGPPSPLSEGTGSAASSAPTSPRHHVASSASAFAPDFTKPIAEEKEQLILAPSTESTLEPARNAGLGAAFWKLRERIINLADYSISAVGKGTPESQTRQDLAPAPRDDFPDQQNAFFDPRSPQPPSPVEMLEAEVTGINFNETDSTHPELQYELQPKSFAL
jgi:hypothetical protein